jgi:DNA replication protein DnaC
MIPLEQKLLDLNLTVMSHRLETTLSEAAGKNLSAAATLEWLADMELEARHGRAIERRFKCSKLQAQPSIDAFHFSHHKSRSQNKNRVLRLLDLTFIANGTNLVLIGNPGVGKTFLSKIVGWRACQANQRVLFTTAMDMLNHLLASQVDHSLVRKLKAYTEPALLICDELGYLALDQQSSNLFYQVISTRHSQKRSTIITTNTKCGAPHFVFNAAYIVMRALFAESPNSCHFERRSRPIKEGVVSDAINLSVARKRPDFSFGGVTASSASRFTDGSARV